MGEHRSISILPAGSDTVASSRIRAYALLAPLARLRHRAHVGIQPDSDVVFVQKRLSPEILSEVRTAKQRGAVVVYDCDDLDQALEYWAPESLVHEIMDLADVVTTNTRAFREAMVGRYRAPRTEILPDAVDYGLQAPITTVAEGRPRLRVLWFGGCNNLRMLEPYVGTLAGIAGCQLVICTHLCERTTDIAALAPGVELVAWSPAAFPGVLRSCHLSVLMHDGGPADRAKSNNRMIASIAWGVPAIVSATPEYERTARLAGVPGAVFHDLPRLVAAIEAHRAVEARQSYLGRAQPVIWANHAPDVVARRFLELLP